MVSVIEELRVKWAKLLVTEKGLDVHTRLLIALFLEDIKRVEFLEHQK